MVFSHNVFIPWAIPSLNTSGKPANQPFVDVLIVVQTTPSKAVSTCACFPLSHSVGILGTVD